MQTRDKIREELAMGITLLAYESIKLDLAPLSLVDEAMRSAGWDAVSEATGDGRTSDYSKFYYNTALKTYAHALCGGYTGSCTVEAAEEGDVLEQLTFPELKKRVFSTWENPNIFAGYLGEAIAMSFAFFIRKPTASLISNAERKKAVLIGLCSTMIPLSYTASSTSGRCSSRANKRTCVVFFPAISRIPLITPAPVPGK